MQIFSEKIQDILVNAEKYHETYYAQVRFRGPSLYFHHRAISTRESADFITHLEYVYAALASWGMHRMGPGGSKMVPFQTFQESIETIREQIKTALYINPLEIRDEDWLLLRDIFEGIKVMASNVSLIGNSKAMHHMMPNIAPPIDRRYTLHFLYGNTNIKVNLNREWEIMKEIISGFYIPVAGNSEFSALARNWMQNQNEFPWDTTVFKIIDNLIVGSRVD